MLETRQLIIRDLVDRGSIAESDITDAHRHASTNQTTLLHALVDLGRASHRDLALARARVSEHPYVDLNQFTIDPDNASLLPRSLAERAGVFPIFVIDGVATVAMLDPLDLQSLELIRQATHHEIEPVVCEEPLLRDLIRKAYAAQIAEQSTARTGSSGDAPENGPRNTQATPAAPPERHRSPTTSSNSPTPPRGRRGSRSSPPRAARPRPRGSTPSAPTRSITRARPRP